MPKYLVCEGSEGSRYGHEVVYFKLEKYPDEDIDTIQQFISCYTYHEEAEQVWQICTLNEDQVIEYETPSHLRNYFKFSIKELDERWWKAIKHAVKCDRCKCNDIDFYKYSLGNFAFNAEYCYDEIS